jgi:hypothetical protein
MINNCPNCGGTHYGSYKCPLIPEEIEANKRKAEEGFWRKHREAKKHKKLRDHDLSNITSRED